MNTITTGPQVLAFLPAFVLAGFWIGGEFLLVASALIFPAFLALTSIVRSFADTRQNSRSDLSAHAKFERMLDNALRIARTRACKTACLVIELDDFEKFTDRHGQSAAETAMAQTLQRVRSVLRSRDQVVFLEQNQVGICVAPVGPLDLDAVLHLASRLQSAISDPIKIGGISFYVTASVGLCRDTQIGNGAGKDLARAATLALQNARLNGPSGIRAYSIEMDQVKSVAQKGSNRIEHALENGEIHPWFQPQISTDTGLVTGFEALARWEHPERGTLLPADFLPVLQRAGKMERLGEVMLSQALGALKAMDTLDLKVPHVGVNFAPDELQNPRLVDKIEWELDRFEMTPERLAVEVLETVVATSPDDTIARNINKLAELGCLIDLDDFGTGHASISSIRRFAVRRLKIDRSFVTRVDQDADQQRMVSAILLMSERLGLDTIAEGVETAGEHNMLSQLGCGHVQGFGIGKPMPFDKIERWVADHLSRLSKPPRIGRQAG